MNIFKAILCIAAMLMTGLATANDTQKLSVCLTDSLTGKERKVLIKWVYFAMASHPELEKNSSISTEERLSTHKEIGALVTRLFVENCPDEIVAAQKSDPEAIRKAFEFVGRVAMQELITHESVMKDISGYIKYTDQQKINELFGK